MEVDEIHQQPCKLPRFENGRRDFNKIARRAGEQYQDDDEDDGEVRGGGEVGRVGIPGGVGTECAHLNSWTGSRIFRVSRASGGKDRHSKVLTAKGLRDRRVRLSVSTAIQFYDLQDRLGYDQPSKAVEWLIKAAADAIAELPSLSSAFSETPKPSDERRSIASLSQTRFNPAELELETEPSYQQQQMSLTKSGGSSTSETSKVSGLSLSRSESRVKARERARERTAKEKEKDNEDDALAVHHHNLNPTSQNASFTELLTSGAGAAASDDGNSPSEPPRGGSDFVNKTIRHLPSTPFDYFGAGIFGSVSSRNNQSSGFSASTQFGNPPQLQSMTMQLPFSVNGDHHELQQYSFMSNHLIPVATSAGSDYNLNSSISSGLGGFNRGTLQSNLASPFPHFQRLSSPVDGPSIPFFMGTAASSSAAQVENPQFPSGFDGRLQLYYGDGCRQSDQKGRGKN